MAGVPGRRRCFYEVLEVDTKATEDEIRKAYRKIALVWHPDKNMHRLDEATERFKEIQSAYAVLSDESERAWYDGHRESILGEGDVDDKLTNLFKYFSASAFSGFDDSTTGFYHIFGAAFDSIIAEEKRYAETPSIEVPPRFGDSSSSHTAVLEFYRFWSSYSSRMSFAWADDHNPLEAPNRFIRRAMEKENKAVRSQARRERTEEIRALVNFCRKRDKRYIAATLELRAQEEEKAAKQRMIAAERSRAAALERERRAEHYAEASEQYHRELAETKAFRLAEEHEQLEKEQKKLKKGGNTAEFVRIIRSDPLLAEEASEARSEDSEEDHLIYCEYCNKTFRSMAALENHERSKKHLAVVASVTAHAAPPDPASEAAEESVMLVKNTSSASSGETSGWDSEESNESDAEEAGESGPHIPHDKRSASAHTSSDESNDEDLSKHMLKMYVQKKSAQPVVPSPASEDKPVDSAGDEPERKLDGAESDSSGGARKPKKRKGKGIGPPSATKPGVVPAPSKSVDIPAETSTEHVAPAKKKSRRAMKGSAVKPSARADGDDQGFSLKLDEDFLSGGSKGVPMHARLNATKIVESLRLTCEVCGDHFETRNDLFKHIRKTGHASTKELGEDEPLKPKGRRK